MKCPHCGRWNRDTFPRCFSCGAELPRPGEGTEKSWQEAMRQEKPQKSYVRVDDLGNATPANDARDHLAREMNRLQERKEQGKLRQQAMREESVRQGLAPSGIPPLTASQAGMGQVRPSRAGQQEMGDSRLSAEEALIAGVPLS